MTAGQWWLNISDLLQRWREAITYPLYPRGQAGAGLLHQEAEEQVAPVRPEGPIAQKTLLGEVKADHILPLRILCPRWNANLTWQPWGSIYWWSLSLSRPAHGWGLRETEKQKPGILSLFFLTPGATGVSCPHPVHQHREAEKRQAKLCDSELEGTLGLQMLRAFRKSNTVHNKCPPAITMLRESGPRKQIQRPSSRWNRWIQLRQRTSNNSKDTSS